ncbi:hypothetical protein ACN4EE_05890 [Geminocystis sp. CENA526]|uniref:hypothetical protein n=1 Tax=Geminocystis sp. CENA526 TaxID=1355871 RepID=UPI003D6DCBC4
MSQVVEVSIADILSRLETKMDSLDRKLETKINKLEDKIDDLEKKFDDKFDRLSNDVNLLRVDLVKVDEKVNRLETSLEEKVNGLDTSLKDKFLGLDKRLGNIEFVARSIAGGIIITLILAAARYFFPNIVL